MVLSGTEEDIQWIEKLKFYVSSSPCCHAGLSHTTQVKFILIWELYKSQDKTVFVLTVFEKATDTHIVLI